MSRKMMINAGVAKMFVDIDSIHPGAWQHRQDVKHKSAKWATTSTLSVCCYCKIEEMVQFFYKMQLNSTP